MSVLIGTITDTDNGITAIISQIGHDTFAVALRDDDAGLVLPTIKTFPELEQAREYARRLTDSR